MNNNNIQLNQNNENKIYEFIDTQIIKNIFR